MAVGEEAMSDTRHTCHWPGCGKPVPPKLLMCSSHWRRLPAQIRSRIWTTYRNGQELDKNPSSAYVAAVRAALDWVIDHQDRSSAA
jgi:hypothetical protein